jgi:enoyl-CoA hydratase
MSYETVKLEQREAVLTITVNRPEVLNAQSRLMLEEFDRALAEAGEDDAVKVVIVAGAGKHFSAGHDIGSPQERADQKRRPYPPGIPGEYKRGRDLYLDNTLRWRDFPKPTIARVQGYCIMGGLMLASACDLIVASDDAKFCDRTVRWAGSHVQYASLPWDIGFRKAKEYLFTGDWITADEAQRLGLVNRVVPRDQLEAETLQLAQRIALQDPLALRLAKFSLNQMQDEMGFRTGITGAFQTYAYTRIYRMEQGEETMEGAERARRRDEAFGDNR